ncbi:MAG: response regulator [Planctomycetes bacterium]|nr:response regulator [Planctomycetota bacterium]
MTSQPAAPLAQPLRVLLVDDSKDDAELLLRALERDFGKPHWRLVDAESALRGALVEHWDVILCDYSLPGFDAFQALAICRECSPDTPLIVVSGSISDETAVACVKAGAQDYLLKDRLSRLAPAVRQALEAAALRREQRRMQAEIELKRRELEQAVRLESIGRFAGGVAHDFRNLLTAIFGACELAREEPDAERRKRLLGIIEQAAQRGATMTQRLLALGKRQELQPEVLDMRRLIGDFSGVLRSLLGSRIRLTTAIAPDVAPVWGDATQLTQILLNLAVNARDAMPNGGELWIRARNARDDERVTGECVVIEVEDNGAGIAHDDLPHIFEPFFTTKAEEGTGLGLSTTLGIVQQSGGTITVSSQVGRGSLFRIVLPSYVSAPLPGARAIRPTARAIPLLVVEDDLVQLALLASLLEPLGYRVFRATGGREAHELIARHPEIEVAAVDIGLADANGRELVEALRVQHPRLRALLISGHATELRELAVRSDTATLAKPFSQNALAAALSALIDEGRSLPVG